MTKHRTIIGFVIVALLAVVATAAAMRSPYPTGALSVSNAAKAAFAGSMSWCRSQSWDG